MAGETLPIPEGRASQDFSGSRRVPVRMREFRHMLVLIVALVQVAAGQDAAVLGDSSSRLVAPVAYSGVRGELDVPLPRIDLDVVIDGVLGDAAWDEAAVLTGFSQYRPVDGLPADDSTEVLVWYSPEAIYFGIRAFEPHGAVNSTLADRDKIDSDDHVQILLDTFNDGRTATVFGVNPLGVQSDGIWIERGVQRAGLRQREGPVDLSPDYLYETRGRLTDYGYEVEMRIPFKSLSFQSDAVQSWGVNVLRRVQHSGREQTWTPTQQGRASFLAQGGRLHGLQGFDRGLVLDINPVVTSSVDGSRHADGWGYGSSAPELGGNVRWGVTSNLTMNGTVNPDFSQVEADAGQTQFDPRRAVFFPEKRPFFLEGSENFATPNRLIYTRRIVSPDGAAKFTGKVSGTEIGFLSAVDSRSSDSEDRPLFSIARVKRDVGEESTVGLAYTDRIEGSNYNRVASADVRLVFGGIYDLQMQGALSFDRTSDGRQTGHLWDLGFRRQGREFGFNVSFKGMSDDLIARSGFLSRVGTVQLRGGPSLTRFGSPGSLIESYTGRLTLDFSWLHRTFMHGGNLDEWWKFSWGNNFAMRGGWALGVSLLIERFYYPPELYTGYFVERKTPAGAEILPFIGEPSLDNFDVVVNVRTPSSSRFSANTFAIFGQDENFDEWASAWILFWTSELAFRPTEQIRVEGRYALQQYWRKTDWSSVRVRQIPRLKLEYQLTRAIFLRFVGQYDATHVDDLRDDSRTEGRIVVSDGLGGFERVLGWTHNDFSFDVLFSFEPSPGTVIFAGYGSSLTEAESFRFRRLERTRDGFFAKLSYLFRT